MELAGFEPACPVEPDRSPCSPYVRGTRSPAPEFLTPPSAQALTRPSHAVPSYSDFAGVVTAYYTAPGRFSELSRRFKPGDSLFRRPAAVLRSLCLKSLLPYSSVMTPTFRSVSMERQGIEPCCVWVLIKRSPDQIPTRPVLPESSRPRAARQKRVLAPRMPAMMST